MKILHNLKWLSLTFVLGISSCNSWLDVDLVNQVEESELFSKPDGFQKALAGVYSDMATSSLYGQNLTFNTLDVMGQLYDYSLLPAEYDDLKDLNYTNSSVRALTDGWWGSLYSVIEETNNILRWTELNASVLSETELNQVRGEALGIRAYLFFDLIRLFAPDVKIEPNAKRIPYNTEFGIHLAPLYTTEETIDLILTDLQEAEECLANDPIVGIKISELPDDTERPMKNSADKYVARMNLYAVKALMARIYLAKGDYPNARIKAQEVINSNCFSLLNREDLIQQTDPRMKDMLFSDEHIFTLRNRDIQTYARGLFDTRNESTGDCTLPFSINYASNYDLPYVDIRWMEWFREYYGQSNASVHMIKFYADEDNAENYFPKVPLIRLSEMYMILSESYLEEDLDKARSYADTLRVSRIGEEGWLYAYSEEEFIREMRREFPGEGQLFFMYKRRNHDILRGDGMSGISASNNAFVLLIPDSEIANGNVEQ